jgi:hypothetical protein
MYFIFFCVTITVFFVFILGRVVQSPISANLGIHFDLLFLFMYFCITMIIRFKTLENKTSIEPEKISGKTYST